MHVEYGYRQGPEVWLWEIKARRHDDVERLCDLLITLVVAGDRLDYLVGAGRITTEAAADLMREEARTLRAEIVATLADLPHAPAIVARLARRGTQPSP